MSTDPSYPIATRSREEPVPQIGDTASTPLPTQADDRRQDGQFVMPETPEQLEELFSRRLSAIVLAALPVRTPARYFSSQSSSSYKSI